MKNKTQNKPEKFHSLSRSIVAQFCIFTLVLSAIYGLFSFMLLYQLEDNFIEREVLQEATYLNAGFTQSGNWPLPRNDFMALYFAKDDLPAEIRPQYIAEPNRKEFYGAEGRHYHLYKLPEQAEVYLVAEVSKRLLVRPISGGVFKFMLISGLVLAFIAFLIAWALGRKTAKPLQQLADLVDGVAPENIPASFAHQFPNNEIGILARTLEQTMQRINLALEREKCFTRDVSHELRTSTAIIKNSVEVYQATKPSTQETDNIVSRIGDASMQMEHTVTILLALAREEQTLVKKEQVALLPLLEQSIIDNSHLLKEKAVKVIVNDNCEARVIGQQGMLKVLLDNLLSNAFQYTEVGEVNVSFNDGQLMIADTGPGIEADISNKITEPMVKGSQSTGYGFGLSIVKRLCEHQNWRLTVRSNKGTSISVAFGDKKLP